MNKQTSLRTLIIIIIPLIILMPIIPLNEQWKIAYVIFIAIMSEIIIIIALKVITEVKKN